MRTAGFMDGVSKRQIKCFKPAEKTYPLLTTIISTSSWLKKGTVMEIYLEVGSKGKNL